MPGEDIISLIASHIESKDKSRLSIGVLSSGNGSNLQALIDFSTTKDSYFKVGSVISNTPGSLALQRAQNHGINYHLVDHRAFNERLAFENKLMSCLLEDDVQLVVLAGFMRVLSPSFLARFKNCVINLHPSLLPKHRGLNAIKQALIAKDERTGSTVHLVDDGLDTGPIIAQSSCPIFSDDDLASVTDRIKQLEHALLPSVVNKIARTVITKGVF